MICYRGGYLTNTVFSPLTFALWIEMKQITTFLCCIFVDVQFLLKEPVYIVYLASPAWKYKNVNK